MQGVLGLVVELKTFGSPGGLQIPNFGSVSFILTLGQSGVATFPLLGVWASSSHLAQSGVATQVDGYDGKVQVVLDNVMIITPTPLIKGAK